MSSSFARSALDPRRWSLTARLAALFAAALTAILFAVTGIQYRELRYQIHEADEAELQRSMAFEQDIVKGAARKKLPEHFEREWIERVGRGDRLFLRVLTPQGAVYAESPGMPPRSAFAPPGSKPAYRALTSSAASLLLNSVSVAVAPGETWSIEGALDVTASDKILATYWTRLCILLVIAVAIASVLGWLLARRGLSPLRRIANSMERISAEQLDERIGRQPWPAELQSLARAFDAMLGRLEASFERLSRFSADLAHEFRTPVNNLVAAASVTMARARSDAEYQDTLAVIVEEGERLTRMISSMLFLARADNAKQAVNREALSTGEEFSKLRDFFEALAEQRGVTITAKGDLPLQADSVLLRRALSNLIANALQHTSSGGEVRLEATQTAEGVRICVTDTGEGIAPEHLPHLFARFYRADASRASSERSGLGLAVVNSIVELHAGTVHIESTVGQGTRVTMEFPR
jgi:two-component system, OmpR family, heavy metal sensor histidine kinase CusS